MLNSFDPKGLAFLSRPFSTSSVSPNTHIRILSHFVLHFVWWIITAWMEMAEETRDRKREIFTYLPLGLVMSPNIYTTTVYTPHTWICNFKSARINENRIESATIQSKTISSWCENILLAIVYAAQRNPHMWCLTVVKSFCREPIEQVEFSSAELLKRKAYGKHVCGRDSVCERVYGTITTSSSLFGRKFLARASCAVEN